MLCHLSRVEEETVDDNAICNTRASDCRKLYPSARQTRDGKRKGHCCTWMSINASYGYCLNSLAIDHSGQSCTRAALLRLFMVGAGYPYVTALANTGLMLDSAPIRTTLAALSASPIGTSPPALPLSLCCLPLLRLQLGHGRAPKWYGPCT